MSLTLRLTKFCAALSAAVLITGCANSPNDPLEGFNRQAFYFNEAIDTVVLKPAAHGYRDLTPEFLQSMVGNFFSNIADVWIAFNNFLQGRGDEGFSDVSRVIINTFAGVGGLFDVASDAGLPKHNADLGQTFGVWGAPPGPYFVIPVLGPSTIRDTIAAPADYWYGDPITYINNDRLSWSAIGLRAVSRRAELIDAVAVIEDAAIDRYEFIRDAHLQRRHNMIHNRNLSEDQWETVNEGTRKTKKDKKTEGQIWLPSGEGKPDSSPAVTSTEAETADVATRETDDAIPAAANSHVTGSMPKKDKPAQVSGPVSAEAAAALIN